MKPRKPPRKPITKADLLDNAAIKAREEISHPDFWRQPPNPEPERRREIFDTKSKY